ncbi:MAG: hypothetical protein U0271_37500 [Polyangiaceae bacterium]
MAGTTHETGREAREPLALERYATIQAEIDAGETLDKILEREKLTKEVWLAAQAHWLKRMADEAQRKRFETTNRYQAIFTAKRKIFEARFERERRKRERAPIEPPPVEMLAGAESELAAPLRAQVPALSFPEPPADLGPRPPMPPPPAPASAPAYVSSPAPPPPAFAATPFPPPPPPATNPTTASYPAQVVARHVETARNSGTPFTSAPVPPPPPSSRGGAMARVTSPDDLGTWDESRAPQNRQDALPFRPKAEPAPIPPPLVAQAPAALSNAQGRLETKPIDVPVDIRNALRAQTMPNPAELARAVDQARTGLPFEPQENKPAGLPFAPRPVEERPNPPGGLPFSKSAAFPSALPFDRSPPTPMGLPFGPKPAEASAPPAPAHTPHAVPLVTRVVSPLDDDDDDVPRTKMVDTTALQAALGGSATPFGVKVPAAAVAQTALAPPPVFQDSATPFAQAPTPHSEPPGPALAKSAPPAPFAAPAPAPAPAQAPGISGTRFNLNQFASLTAEIAEAPHDAEAIRRRYRLTEADHHEEWRKWTEAFQRNDELRQQYLVLVQRYRGYMQARTR